MRILFITNNMPLNIDGVGDYTANLAREFARYGHFVTVVCRDCRYIKTNYEDIKVYPVVRTWNRAAVQSILEVIRVNTIEWVCLQYVPHGFHPKGLPFGLLSIVKAIRKQAGVKLMTFCHEVSTFSEKGDFKSVLLSLMVRFITKQILSQSNVMATSIDYYKRMMRSLIRNVDIGVIPIASNIPSTFCDKNNVDLLRKSIATNDEVIISFFGLRDITVSIAALNELKKEGCNIKVMFIGKLPQVMPDDILFDTYKTGVLNVTEINKFFKVSDILVLPQDNRFGCSFKSGSLAAAMTEGLPVITAKGCLTSEELIDGENVVFTDFTNVECVKSAVLSLVKSPELRWKIGDGAKNCSKERTWQYTYQEYIKLMMKWM